MDQVVVKGPGYRSEDCKAGKEAGSALARVKKVVSQTFSARRMEKWCSAGVGYYLWFTVIDEYGTYSSRTNARNSRSASPRGPSPSYRPYLPSQLSPGDPGREDDFSARFNIESTPVKDSGSGFVMEMSRKDKGGSRKS